MDEKDRNEIKVTDIENEIRDLTDDIEVPPSLEPEAVENLLRERARGKRKAYRWKYAGIAAAACLCVVIGITAVLTGGIGGGAGNDTGAGDESMVEKGETGSAAEDGYGVSELATAADYDEIYEYIEAEQKYMKKQAKSDGGTSVAGSSADESVYSGNSGATAESAMGSGSSTGSAGYSDTNVREEGVGEADVVKTDGENLYILDGQTVHIVGIGSKEMQALSQISFDGNCYIREIYVESGKLMILYTRTDLMDEEENGGYYKERTCADVYDVSDPSSPEKINTVSQSGNYNTVRVSGGYVYLLSDFYPYGQWARTDTGSYIPEVQGKLLDPSAIYMPQGKMGNSYTVISSFRLDDPSGKTDSRAVFGVGGLCYVSGKNIYITEVDYGMSEMTSVRKISYSDGKLKGTAQTKVKGTLNDSFCIDEYEGYLRMVVTIQPSDINGGIMPLDGTSSGKAQTSNSLYVLDENLEKVGEISGLAEEESVYSARFMGDAAYFVTFKQVDPLFSVDLTDPENPEIIGELKIPGFSEYLHPYGEGMLLGIGMAVDEETVTAEGLKLSMFDITDPENVQETSNYVMKGIYGSDALYNYRAVFVDTEKNLFGFSAYGDETEYYLFSYDDKDGFREIFSRRLSGYYDARGLYAGQRFYLIAGNTVESYDMSDFSKIDDIVL